MDRLKNLKPGDLVWCLEDDDYVCCKFMALCNNYVIVCDEYAEYADDFNDQLKEMSSESNEYGTVEVNIFHKSDVFLTESDVMKQMH